jgi:hypothetical protein
MVLSLASDRAVADREPGLVKLFRRQLQNPPRPERGRGMASLESSAVFGRVRERLFAF